MLQWSFAKFPKKINRVKLSDNRDRNRTNSEIQSRYQKRPFLIDLSSSGRGPRSVLTGKLQVTRMEMSNEIGSPIRDDQAFWRAHHEAWQHSALNHRQYYELHRFR